ncbi:MAG: CreA family protein [Chitinophagaceae bacterium]
MQKIQVFRKQVFIYCPLLFVFLTTSVQSEEIGCITTTWKLIGANHKVCVQVFDDPKVKGVACHISQAKTGGIAGTFGVAEDPSQFSISCRQVGPVVINGKLPKEETAFTEDTSLFFKETKVTRLFDSKRNTLVYVAISRKLIEGAPANSISTVPIMPWGEK